MNCGFCGQAFSENRSQPACRQCPVGSGCGLIRCPHCGYENPGTPGWIAYLKRKFGKGPEVETPTPTPSPEQRGFHLPVIQPPS